MKELHIISTGVSIITNAQKANIIPSDVKISNEGYWRSMLDNPNEIRKIKEFIEKDPYKHSAELNTFLRVVGGKERSNIEVYIFGTKTSSNELCRRALEWYLKDNGFKIYNPYEISGYFWEAKFFDESYAVEEFKRGISELIDRLVDIATRKKKEGYKVYFNPTGGLKAHVIASALAGFLTGSDVYYMNEEFNDVVFLPPMFYIPKGKEIEVLEQLKSGEPLSGKDYERFKKNYNNEIKRLEVYGLVEIERDKANKDFRIRITHRGKLILEELRRD